MDTEVVVREVWHVRLVRRYKETWFDRHFRFSMPVALAAFVLSLLVNFWAIHQATNNASNRVDDIILSNIPVFEVDGLFVYGTFVVVAYAIAILLWQPKRIPFALHGLTLFILVRSAFTLMTHLGAPEASYVSDFGEAITKSFFGADQFFSGHTGMPFLGALAFWNLDTRVRNFFLAASAYFAVIVLLGHIHYTIDVASAFFITYGIYHLAIWLFPKEHTLFVSRN